MAITGKTISAIAAMMGTLLGTNQEAEASLRSDAAEMIQKALNGFNMSGRAAGIIDSQQATQSLKESGKYKGGKGYFTQHGLVHRNEADDKWPAEKIEQAYKEIFDSPETLAVPNVLGMNPNAQEALWNPKSGIYAPIAPYKKGFKALTVYDPETQQVERLLKEKGYWEGGSTSPYLPPIAGSQARLGGSGPISAVNNPFENKIRGLDGLVNKKIIPPALLATALGGDSAKANPSFDPIAYARSLGIDDKPLEEPWWSPADLAVAPVGASGIPAKVLATALDGPLNVGINAAFSRLFGNQ